jgi:hypothetical protein
MTNQTNPTRKYRVLYYVTRSELYEIEAQTRSGPNNWLSPTAASQKPERRST